MGSHLQVSCRGVGGSDTWGNISRGPSGRGISLLCGAHLGKRNEWFFLSKSPPCNSTWVVNVGEDVLHSRDGLCQHSDLGETLPVLLPPLGPIELHCHVCSEAVRAHEVCLVHLEGKWMIKVVRKCENLRQPHSSTTIQ
jgi:hypothetical protein